MAWKFANRIKIYFRGVLTTTHSGSVQAKSRSEIDERRLAEFD